MRRLDGVEDLLPTVDVLARPGELVLVNPGVLSLAVDVRDAVRRAEDEMPVDDLEVVAVERAHRRSRGAVALRVVLAAVAGAAVAARWDRRDHGDVLPILPLDVLRLVVLHRTVRLHRAAQVRAAVRDDREARLAVQEPVVADVRRSVRNLTRLGMHEELRHEPLALGEVRQRAEVDLGIALLAIGGDYHEPQRRYGDESADHTAEAERGELEELAPREPLTRRRLRHRRLAPV